MFSNAEDRRFVIGMLVAFLPAAVIGAAAGSYIKAYLFNPWVVCFSLIVGGAILLWVDQLDLKPHEHDATTFPLPMYLSIGFAQCLAMIPGVSRSGASIVAAMLLGADKHAAAEFSFFLAIPTMVGAFVYEFYKNRADMTPRSHRHHRDRIRGVVRHRDHRGQDVPDLRHPPRLHAVRVVARHRRHARPGRAGDGEVRLARRVRVGKAHLRRPIVTISYG